MNIVTPEPRAFAVIGGDLRQVCLARQLAADRHEVFTYANEAREHSPADKSIKEVAHPSALPRGCVVVLPLPAVAEGGLLSAPLSKVKISINELLDTLAPGTPVMAGMVRDELAKAAAERGLRLVDYFEREELAVANAAATAEAAIALAADNLPVTLGTSRALVVGFGRIGKLLTLGLRGLGCRVSASARKYEDLAWIEAFGARAVRTESVADLAQDYDVIFNTVPSRVLGRDALERVKRDAVVIDLASKPGGLDFDAARELGVNVIWALSLPGKTSPITAGAIIRDSIYNILYDGGI